MTNRRADKGYNSESEKLSTARPILRRYFMICQTCFWCALYMDTMCTRDDLPYETCPTCNDIVSNFPDLINKIESLLLGRALNGIMLNGID